MLGNDVVDLLDVDARPETFRSRFEARVFAAKERRSVAQSENPNVLRWAHWGAKEAAYKLLRQGDPRFVFSPGKLVAHFEPIARGALGPRERHGRLEVGSGPPQVVTGIELRSFETRDYVHVVALPGGADWGTVAMAVESIEGRREAPSLAVRRLALREIGRDLGIEAGRLSIGRRDRVPTVELDGRTTNLSLSLSHHGRFVAYAMAPRGRGVRFVRPDGVELDEHDGRGARERTFRQAVGSVGCPVRAAETGRMAG